MFDLNRFGSCSGRIVGNPSVTRPNGQRRVRCELPVIRPERLTPRNSCAGSVLLLSSPEPQFVITGAGHSLSPELGGSEHSGRIVGKQECIRSQRFTSGWPVNGPELESWGSLPLWQIALETVMRSEWALEARRRRARRCYSKHHRKPAACRSIRDFCRSSLPTRQRS
jgi:hypothetical protein